MSSAVQGRRACELVLSRVPDTPGRSWRQARWATPMLVVPDVAFSVAAAQMQGHGPGSGSEGKSLYLDDMETLRGGVAGGRRRRSRRRVLPDELEVVPVRADTPGVSRCRSATPRQESKWLRTDPWGAANLRSECMRRKRSMARSRRRNGWGEFPALLLSPQSAARLS